MCDTTANLLTNCSFETGDFTGWVTQDLSDPFFALTVAGPTNVGYGFFTSDPSEGVVSALHGFDGNGPGTIEIGQDVTLPADPAASLTFDYRGAWDLDSFSGEGTADRTFSVIVEPSGGGSALDSTLILTAPGDTINNDTGLQTGAVDLSSFAGQSIRVNFVWSVPEDFSGPGFFELDNVSVTAQEEAVDIPAFEDAGLALLAGLLVAGAWTLLWRRHSRS